MSKTFLVFPKSTEQILWESIRHELSRQYVVPDCINAEVMVEFLIALGSAEVIYESP